MLVHNILEKNKNIEKIITIKKSNINKSKEKNDLAKNLKEVIINSGKNIKG